MKTFLNILLATLTSGFHVVTIAQELSKPQVFWKIQGVGAASGMIYKNDKLYIISDNSNLFYEYGINDGALSTNQVFKGKELENVPKKKKADLEAISEVEGTYYLFGSGSSSRRQSLIQFEQKNKKSKRVSLKKTYRKLKKRFDIKDDDFNIEGALFLKNELWLFNRGNGPAAKNGIFILDKDHFQPKSYHPVPLGSLNDVQLGITDAILCDNKIYFIAAAEGVGSTYHDGEIQGTVFGELNLDTKEVVFNKVISTKNKFEGLTLYKQSSTQIDFLLCEDPDDGGNSSIIYQLRLKK